MIKFITFSNSNLYYLDGFVQAWLDEHGKHIEIVSTHFSTPVAFEMGNCDHYVSTIVYVTAIYYRQLPL